MTVKLPKLLDVVKKLIARGKSYFRCWKQDCPDSGKWLWEDRILPNTIKEHLRR